MDRADEAGYRRRVPEPLTPRKMSTRVFAGVTVAMMRNATARGSQLNRC